MSKGTVEAWAPVIICVAAAVFWVGMLAWVAYGS